MSLGKFTQSKDEKKRYEIDYSDWLDTGETVSSIALSSTPSTTPPLVGDDQTINPEATGATFMVSGGATDELYTLVVRMTTSGGQIKEDAITFNIREPI